MADNKLDIKAFLDKDEQKDLLRLLTAGSVDDGKSTLIVFSMHIHCADLMVFVGIIIIDSLCHITAGSIQCDLIRSISNFTASPLLIH